jgi:hypothetical protein
VSKFTENRIRELYLKLIERLPSTYPKADLIIHNSTKALRQSYTKMEGKREGNDLAYAFCYADCDANDAMHVRIHISLEFNGEHKSNIIWYFLHEIGHLFALQKYGWKDPRWDNYKISERYANGFANRWISRLKNEDWIE